MRTAVETGERGGLSETYAVVTIDAALSTTSHRAAYSHDELVSLLNEIVATVRNPDAFRRVMVIVDGALGTFSDQIVIDGSRIVDLLLDLRLTLARVPELI
jgi:hypothetical protein